MLEPDASFRQLLERCPRLSYPLSPDTTVKDTSQVDQRPRQIAAGQSVFPPRSQARMNQSVRVPIVLVVGVDGSPEPGSVRGPQGPSTDSAHIRAAVATFSTTKWCPGASGGQLVRVRVSTGLNFVAQSQ